MDGVLGRVLGWIMGGLIPDFRRAWGNPGCFVASVVAVVILVVWLFSSSEEAQGQDWRTLLVAVVLAVVALAGIGTAMYGLMPGSTTVCPHCGGEILARAIVCKFCRRRTDRPASEPTPEGGGRAVGGGGAACCPGRGPGSRRDGRGHCAVRALRGSESCRR
jgi:hypothetical protein